MICLDLLKMKHSLVELGHWDGIKSYEREYNCKEIHQLNGVVESNKEHMQYDPETRHN